MGIVYILKNESMPGFVKVGMTENSVEERMKQLDTTGVPVPFECFYAREVEDMQPVEKLLHDVSLDARTRRNREFFQIDPERVRSALMLAPGSDVFISEADATNDKDDLASISRVSSKRGRFSFDIVNITPGERLIHTHDDTIYCTVVDARNVDFEDEIMSLSKSAGIVLERMGLSPRVAGTNYWTYEGRRLMELRD